MTAFRCHRKGCGEGSTSCFHWPGLFIDRSADEATNALFARRLEPKPAPAPPPSTLGALVEFNEPVAAKSPPPPAFELAPQHAPTKRKKR